MTTSHLSGWTDRHGIEHGESSVRLAVTNAGTAHVMAAGVKNFELVTACDLYFSGQSGSNWFSVGSYDSDDIDYVLSASEAPSFKRVCSRCARKAEEMTGIKLV